MRIADKNNLDIIWVKICTLSDKKYDITFEQQPNIFKSYTQK